VYQRVVAPVVKMVTSTLQDGHAIWRPFAAPEIVTYISQDTAQPGFLHGARDRRRIVDGAGTGIDHGRETAAQRFKCCGLGSQINKLGIENTLEWHPDPTKDF
jgi:hypothetical protein